MSANSGKPESNLFNSKLAPSIQKSTLARSSPLSQDPVTINEYNQNGSNIYFSSSQKSDSPLSTSLEQHAAANALSSSFNNKLSIFDRAHNEFLGDLPPPPPRHRPLGAKHRSGSYSLSFLPGTNVSSAFSANSNLFSSNAASSNANPWSTHTNNKEISTVGDRLFNSNQLSGISGFNGANGNTSLFESKLKSNIIAANKMSDYDVDQLAALSKTMDYLGLDDTTAASQRFNSLLGNDSITGQTFLGTSIFDKPKLMLNQPSSSLLNNSSNTNDSFIPFPKKSFVGSSGLGDNSLNSTMAASSSLASPNPPKITQTLPNGLETSVTSNGNSSNLTTLPTTASGLSAAAASNKPKPIRRPPFLYNTHQRSSSIAFLESQQTDVGPQPISTNVHRRIASFGGRKLEDEIFGNNLGLGAIGTLSSSVGSTGASSNPTLSEKYLDLDDLSNTQTSQQTTNAPAPSSSPAKKEEEKDKEEKQELSLENEDYEINMAQESKTLWVEPIDGETSATEIITPFTKFGEIEFMRIVPEKSGAFITYVDEEDAVKAKNGLTDIEIANKKVTVGYGRISLADPANDEKGLQPTKSLWIGNIPQSIGNDELGELFSKFGKIESARVLTHKNCGFVNFEKLEDAIKAKLEMNGKEIDGTDLRIGYAKVPPKGEQIVTNTNNNNQNKKNANTSNNDSSTSNNKTAGNNNNKNESNKNELPSITIPLKDGAIVTTDSKVEYFSTIPPLPESESKRKIDQNKLREIRKKLDGRVSAKDIDSFYEDIIDDTVELCTDYIGNVVIQKIIEKTDDQNKVLRLIELVAPYMASFGVHKNGTWVVQKMIDCAKTQVQIQKIIDAIRAYTPPLLLDQFGNYVVQCCLRLGTKCNQFVFDAMAAKCLDIGLGRFGARSVRACLESQYTTKRQQKQVALAILHNSVQLCTNPNGAILLTWLLDTSSLPGRYRALAPKLLKHVSQFCCHKLASATILKLVNQRTEIEAREMIINEIFFSEDNKLDEILRDQIYGVSVIQKILSNGCINMEEKIRLADRIREVLVTIGDIKPTQISYKRLLDELAVIPTNLGLMENSAFIPGSIYSVQDIVSPLTPTTPMSSFFTTANPNLQTQPQSPQALAASLISPTNQTAGFFQGQAGNQLSLYPPGYIAPQQNVGVYPFGQYSGYMAAQNPNLIGKIQASGTLSPISQTSLAQFAQLPSQANFFLPTIINQQQNALLSTSPGSQIAVSNMSPSVQMLNSNNTNNTNANPLFNQMNQYIKVN
jgi:RNA recognition motif-containing protein